MPEESDKRQVMKRLREQRRDAARGMQRAKNAGNRILEQKYKREVTRLDAEIGNLE
jgi:hypothetical protein